MAAGLGPQGDEVFKLQAYDIVCGNCRWSCDTSSVDNGPRRGGDGQWYCYRCWTRWWAFEENAVSDCPLVNKLFPRWCEHSATAMDVLFPRNSSLFELVAQTRSLQDGAHVRCDELGVDARDVASAVRQFFENGFVVLRGALRPEAAQEVETACRLMRNAALARDVAGVGNRGRGRYTFKSVAAPGECFHLSAFARHLVDNQPVLDVLDEIFARIEKRRCKRKSEGVESCGSKESGRNHDTFANDQEPPPYYIVGAGGDFCEGWVREFQQLHTDYGGSRPFRGPEFFEDRFIRDSPIHDKEAAPIISVNYAVQALHRWNGAMRIIPWPEIEKYVAERSAGRRPDEDTEQPPGLEEELELRPRWLAARVFPLEVGDVLLRDVRLWHGGCPNLSRAPRFLPSIEVASRDLIAYYSGSWPHRVLPAAHAREMSCRARRLCAAVAADDGDSYFQDRLDDFGWLMWKVGSPARHDSYLPSAHLGPQQSELVSLRACLEQLQSSIVCKHGVGECSPYSNKNGEGVMEYVFAGRLTDDQKSWLDRRLMGLASGATAPQNPESNAVYDQARGGRMPHHEKIMELIPALLDALARGPDGEIFNKEACWNDTSNLLIERYVGEEAQKDNVLKIVDLASQLLSHLRVMFAAERQGCVSFIRQVGH